MRPTGAPCGSSLGFRAAQLLRQSGGATGAIGVHPLRKNNFPTRWPRGLTDHVWTIKELIEKRGNHEGHCVFRTDIVNRVLRAVDRVVDSIGSRRWNHQRTENAPFAWLG